MFSWWLCISHAENFEEAQAPPEKCQMCHVNQQHHHHANHVHKALLDPQVLFILTRIYHRTYFFILTMLKNDRMRYAYCIAQCCTICSFKIIKNKLDHLYIFCWTLLMIGCFLGPPGGRYHETRKNLYKTAQMIKYLFYNFIPKT